MKSNGFARKEFVLRGLFTSIEKFVLTRVHFIRGQISAYFMEYEAVSDLETHVHPFGNV